jgi:polysaccharide biosynthesis transport protein
LNKSSELSPYFIERLREQHGPLSRGPVMAAPEEQPTLREYWHVLRRHLTLVVTIAACVMIVSSVAVFVVTPMYTAAAVILIEPQAPQVLDIKQLTVEQTAGDEHDYYKTQYSLLRSRSLAAEVIHDLGLQSNPDFNGSGQPHGLITLLWGRFESWAGGLLTAGTVAGAGEALETSGVSAGLVNVYLSDLTIQPDFGTRLVRIAFSTPDPKLSAAVANAHADNYVRQGMELRARANQAAQHFLEGKLVELRERVERSEAALNTYRHDKGIVEFSTNGRNEILLKRLEDLNSALTYAETRRIGLESQADLISKGDYFSLPGVVASPMVQTFKSQAAELEAQYASMSSRYNLAYRPLAALKAKLDETNLRLKDTVGEIMRSVKLEYRAAVGRENELQLEVDREKSRALALNDASLKDAILAREVDTNRQLYESVLKRMKEMGVEAEVRSTNVSLVDKAVPPGSPSSPRKAMVIVLSAVLGLTGAIGIAFFLEYLDDTLKTPDEVERYLRLPSLAFVPDMHSLQNGNHRNQIDPETAGLRPVGPVASPHGPPLEKPRRDGLRHRWALASAHEAYRTIRSQILLSRAGEPPHTVLVTSAVPEEGKSITAVNTAITFAHKGRRVLLVDADLRRARCHELLQCDGRQGLSEVLTGQLELDDAVAATEVPNLFLLSAGAVPPDPPELLGSSKMNELLKVLEVRYEHVIIDSAPVMPISDSIVLSKLVDGVVVVVGRSTSKQLVKRACTRISDTGARLLGVVLNRVSAYHASYYPYNGYYHYYDDSSDRSKGTGEHARIVFD